MSEYLSHILENADELDNGVKAFALSKSPARNKHDRAGLYLFI